MTPARPRQGLLGAVAGRTAVLLSAVALRLGRFATARSRAVATPEIDLGLRPCLCGMGDAPDRDHKQGCRRRGDYDRAMARLGHPSAAWVATGRALIDGQECPSVVPMSYACPRCRLSGEQLCTHPRGA
jgi:hypothetical protein